MTLSFFDDFETLDRNVWNTFQSQPAIINGELQAYVPESFELNPEGGLRIKTEKKPYTYKSITQEWTSGQMTTFGSFSQTYGYFEIRAKFTKGNGLWPAFWLLARDLWWPPEIDIFEFLGRDPLSAYQTVHWKDQDGNREYKAKRTTGIDFTKDYHTFAIDWSPGLIIYYIDGKETVRREGAMVPAKPMYMIVNTAVGKPGGWCGGPDETTPKVSYYDIDYIRVFKYTDVTKGTKPLIKYPQTVLSKDFYQPGETVQILTGITVGNQNLSQVVMKLRARGFFGRGNIGKDYYHNFGDVLKGKTYPAKFNFEIPLDTEPGTYMVSVNVPQADNPEACPTIAEFTVTNKKPERDFYLPYHELPLSEE